MIRGTAAQFKFKIPYSLDELEWIYVKVWQPQNPNRSVNIIKSITDCSEPINREVYVSLDANETSRFSDKYKAKVQMNALPKGGVPFGSKERWVTVYSMSDDIINTGTTPPATEDGWIILDGENIIANNV